MSDEALAMDAPQASTGSMRLDPAGSADSAENENRARSPSSMRVQALAVDYDGTLAPLGQVAPEVIVALEKLKQSGRKVILVTGRRLADLFTVFPPVEVFDRVVAENGALLYRPQTKESRLLAPALPAKFVEALEAKRLSPLEVGSCLAATVTPNETVVLETIRDLGLELHVIFNKGAVMVLPAGVTKAVGLAAALEELGIAADRTAALGDAENDHALLKAAGFGAAVSTAIPSLKETADYVTVGGAGSGAIELIESILRDDLRGLAAASPHR